MNQIKINILKKGDTVLFMNHETLAIKRKGGEVDVYRIYLDDQKLLRIDMENVITIGFGAGTISCVVDDEGTEIITF